MNTDDDIDYSWKIYKKTPHKGGGTINKILNINNDKDDEFSINDYQNAIANERMKRANVIKTRINIADVHRRDKMNGKYGSNTPERIEAVKHRVMKQRVAQVLNSRVRNQHNSVHYMRQHLLNTGNTQFEPDQLEVDNDFKGRVMTERVNQVVSSNIRRHHNKTHEMRQLQIASGLTNPRKGKKAWNINSIQIKQPENGTSLANITITKQRGIVADDTFVDDL